MTKENKIKLTKKAIDNAAIKPKRYYLWDTEITGFGLSVQKTGYKSYFMDYRNSNSVPKKN